MAADDIFCGECGHVSRAVSDTFSRPRDTVVIDRIEALAIPEADDVEPAPAPVEIAAEPPASEAPGTEAAPAEENSATAAEPKPPVALNRPQSPPFAEAGDIEATRIVRKEAGIRFVLQFSTGESFTVYGTGLVGRNPKPEPGEYVDQVVRVLDPSRSVSKTHLEFGQEDGTFWIADRFSGNGTIAREPESPPVRCAPNTRHRISRGTRVEIGEQFFIVS
jgi:hypothetical protein